MTETEEGKMWLCLLLRIVINGISVRLWASIAEIVEIELAITLTDLNPKLPTGLLRASNKPHRATRNWSTTLCSFLFIIFISLIFWTLNYSHDTRFNEPLNDEVFDVTNDFLGKEYKFSDHETFTQPRMPKQARFRFLSEWHVLLLAEHNAHNTDTSTQISLLLSKRHFYRLNFSFLLRWLYYLCQFYVVVSTIN